MGQARLHQTPLALLGDELFHRTVQLLPSGCRALLLLDPGPSAHHLRQGPVRDTLSVGQAATLMPVASFLDPVEEFKEFPEQA